MRLMTSEAPNMPRHSSPLVTDGYRRYVIAILFVVSVVNYIDRQILAILLPPIKAELDLSDTQLGFLTGIAFAVLYALAGIPIARIADHWNRKNVISIAIAVWSAMTALSGFAQSFAQLALARVGVGFGEAGGSPPAYSLISDYFPPERRATALSIYTLGIPVGVLIGFLAGGWINEFFGWRTAFFVVGVPGLLLAFIVYSTLREPTRGLADGLTAARSVPSFAAVVRHLYTSPSYRHLMAAVCLVSLNYGCVLAWIPSFLVRSHGMTTGEIGTWLALVVGFAGGAGTLVGGRWSDHLSRSDRRWYLWLPGAAVLSSVPFAALVLWYPVREAALLILSVPVILYSLHLGPFGASLQGLASVRMRASVTAVSLCIVNLIGLGFGPQVVGILSDVLAADYGDESLRYALLAVMSAAGVWSAVHYFAAAKTFRADWDASLELSRSGSNS